MKGSVNPLGEEAPLAVDKEPNVVSVPFTPAAPPVPAGSCGRSSHVPPGFPCLCASSRVLSTSYITPK